MKKYIANKTVVRHFGEKKTTVLTKGQTYTEEAVKQMPYWYLNDDYLSEVTK